MLGDPAAVPRPWLDDYPPGVPPTYRYPQVPLTRFLDDAVRDFPDVVAVELDGVSWTYERLGDEVAAMAAGLRAAGIGPGERVAIALPNIPPAVAMAFATWRIGAVLVPLEPSLSSAEIVRILEDAAAAALVATGDLLRRLADDRASRTTRVTVSVDPSHWQMPAGLLRRVIGRPLRWVRPEASARAIPLPEFQVPGTAGAQQPVDTSDLAVLAYTTGTAGPRRGVMLSHGNLVANAFQARLWVPDAQAGRERLLAAVPFGRIHGLTLGLLVGVLSAATLVLVDAPDGDRLLTTIERGRPTLFPAKPELLHLIAEHPKAGKRDLTSLRACVCVSGPLDPAAAQRVQSLTHGARIRQAYGLTEAGALVLANPIYGRTLHDGIGLPVTDTVVVVVDPASNRIQPAGQVGELAVAGPQVMSGYWNDPAATAAARRGPWLLTGDLGSVDKDGWFAFAGRTDPGSVVELSGTGRGTLSEAARDQEAAS